MSIATVLVTGANRGLGLEFVKQLLKLSSPPKVIIATCRDPAKAQDLVSLSKEHSNVRVVKFDVTDYGSHKSLVDQVAESDAVQDRGLDVLINNAGIYNKVSLESGGPELIMQNVEVNAVAPFYLSQAFLPLLRQAAKAGGRKPVIANITSKMGSIAENTSGGHYAYRASKAAMNMMSKSMDVDLRPEGISCVAIHPGWVLTDMGGPNALINTETSVGHMIQTIDRVAAGELGTDGNIFLDFTGKLIPW